MIRIWPGHPLMPFHKSGNTKKLSVKQQVTRSLQNVIIKYLYDMGKIVFEPCTDSTIIKDCKTYSSDLSWAVNHSEFGELFEDEFVFPSVEGEYLVPASETRIRLFPFVKSSYERWPNRLQKRTTEYVGYYFKI